MKPEMTLKSYENFVKELKIYKNAGQVRGFMGYSLPGLMGEVGELASIQAKAWRDHSRPDEGSLIAKELGDIAFLLVCCITDWGFTLEEILETNVQKLEDRRRRGTLQGSGDDR